MKSGKVAIVCGGGIGGIAAGIALQRTGWQVEVFEERTEAREAGAGLQIWSNAANAIKALGLFEKFAARAQLIRSMIVFKDNGELVNHVDMSGVVKKFGANTYMIRRQDLLDLLVAALGRDRISFGKRVVGFHHQGKRIVAEFEDGDHREGDLLIGADGVQSSIRSHLHGVSQVHHTGDFSWRAITPFESKAFPPGTAFIAMGPGSQFGFFHLSERDVYWFATRSGQALAREGVDTPNINHLKRWFSHWPFPIMDLIGRTKEDSLLRHPILDIRPHRTWGESAMTLLGDAAHASTPHLGQGACMALEDAVVLAACLNKGRAIADALREYERQRYSRTAMVQKQSHLTGLLLQTERSWLIRVRNLWTSLTPSWAYLIQLSPLLSFRAPQLLPNGSINPGVHL